MIPSKCIPLIIAVIGIAVSLTAASAQEDSRAVIVSGGENHTLVLTADGFAWGCGENGLYQLGIGNTFTNQKLLVRVHGPNDVNFIENIIDIDAGWKHSLAVDANNNAWAWGWNNEGQLGDESTEERATPVLVHDGEMGTVSDFLENIIAVSAGRSGEYSLAIDDANHVWSFGKNNKGQLGDGTITTPRTTPVAVHAGPQNLTRQLSEPLCARRIAELVLT